MSKEIREIPEHSAHDALVLSIRRLFAKGVSIKYIAERHSIPIKRMRLDTETCPKCDGLLSIANGNQKHCTKCLLYKIDGKWMMVCCDEYHRHNKNCLIEVSIKKRR